MNLPQNNGENRRRQGLPINKKRNTANGEDQNLYRSMFDDNEAGLTEEEKARSERFVSSKNNNDPTAQAIIARQNELQRKYPTGGVRTRRVITTEILLNAPEGYFDKHYDFVLSKMPDARAIMVSRGIVEQVSNALSNPMDEAMQEEVYSRIDSIVSEMMDDNPYNSASDKSIVRCFMINELIGYGPLDTFWRDKKISEIIIAGPSIVRIEISGQLIQPRAVNFRSSEHLDDLIEKIYRGSSKKPSAATPLVKGNLADKTRVFTVHTSIAPAGPNINIRKHPERFWSPRDLVKLGAASEELMTYIGNLVHKGASVLVVGGTHSGKALTLDTMINTPHGQISMKEIKEGDEIFGSLGEVGKVTGKFMQEPRQVYALVTSDREVTFCDIEHNWLVEDSENGEQKVMTTKELLDAGLKRNGKHRFSIPVIKTPVVYSYNNADSQEFQHHPYKVGLSVSRMASIPDYYNSLNSTSSNEYRNSLIEHEIIHKEDSIDEFKKKIKNYVGPLEIDRAYRHASVNSRKMFLDGLIDGIGYANASEGTWSLMVTSEELAGHIQELASSLAYRTSVIGPEKKNYVQEGTRIENLDMWEVKIITSDILGLHPQWGYLEGEMTENNETTNIVSIVEVEGRVEEMACITVNTENSVYTINNSFTITHNTTLLNAITGFYKNNINIVTMEDNIEMKPNPTKTLAAPMETRPKSSSSTAEPVEMTDLVKASTQMRPDVIIVGEVTDISALDLMEVLNTGHFGSSTVHANSAQAAVPRMIMLATRTGLVEREAALEMFSQAFDIIVVTKYSTVDGSRRIVNVSEVGREPKIIDGRLSLPTKTLWTFEDNGLDENRKIIGNWVQVSDISEERIRAKQLQVEKDLTWEELDKLSYVPDEMQPKVNDD